MSQSEGRRPAVRLPDRSPESFARVNSVLRRVLASPLARVLPLPLAVLRFTGRKSGKRIETPVGVHHADGTFAVITRAGWRANFRGEGAPVEIVLRGRPRQGRATVDENPERAADFMLQLLRGGLSPRQLGLDVDKGHTPTREELAATGSSVVRITLA